MISKDGKAEQSENLESGKVWKMNVTYAMRQHNGPEYCAMF